MTPIDPLVVAAAVAQTLEQLGILFVRALANEFHVDEEDAVAAARHRVSFNAIHFQSSLKLDFFPAEELLLA